MAENTELDVFLKGGTPEPEAAPEPEAPPAPEPEQKADAAGGGDKKPPDAAPEPDDEPPEPREGEALVPRRAFEAVRHERQDWKSKAVAAETTAAELRRQLEEAKRAVAPQPQPPYQPPPEIPNPAHDPAGYHAYIQQERIRDSINDRLNLSEVLAREKYGEEKVEAMKREFLAAKEADPSLGERLIRQAHPYEFAFQELERIKARQEIGDDPVKYRERLRAEWEAERATGQPSVPRVSPANGMAPSLASVRSVAGRSAPSWTGAPSLDDILATRAK